MNIDRMSFPSTWIKSDTKMNTEPLHDKWSVPYSHSALLLDAHVSGTRQPPDSGTKGCEMGRKKSGCIDRCPYE